MAEFRAGALTTAAAAPTTARGLRTMQHLSQATHQAVHWGARRTHPGRTRHSTGQDPQSALRPRLAVAAPELLTDAVGILSPARLAQPDLQVVQRHGQLRFVGRRVDRRQT